MSFRNILIVDGNPTAASQLSRTLTALGYHVAVAPSGSAALQIARGDHFDVGIFSELLPDGDGASLYRRVAAIQNGLRGVLVAAVGNLATVWSAISAGMQRVIVQPVDIHELLPIVEAPMETTPAAIATARDEHPFTEASISRLTSEEIRYRLSREELVAVIRAVDYPFAGKERLLNFDRDTLERVVHLIRRWCQSRQPMPV